ncbi:MAG: HEAT repeat domain-containing protein [Elusimicrobia bacterium]|nr:HEAT repeat domain-containing protein [Elusimicrobiota bacterium]
MSYEIEAFLGRRVDLLRWTAELPSSLAASLFGELGLVPLTDELADQLRRWKGSEAAPMTEAVPGWCRHASRQGPLAHATASYFGGEGRQSCDYWADGEPRALKISINDALARFGVRESGGRDAFDTVGMGRHRCTTGWAVEAVLDDLLGRGAPKAQALADALSYERDDKGVQYGVRCAAAARLQASGAEAAAAFDALARAFREDPGFGVRLNAACALAAAGPGALRALAEGIDPSLDHDRLWPPLFALRSLGPAAGPAAGRLAAVLRNPDWRLRAGAAETLACMGPAASAADEALAAALDDPNEHVRRHAVLALGALGPAARRWSALLAAAVRDPSPSVRESADKALRAVSGT